MPAVVAFFVRQLIIIAVQLGIFALIDKFVTPYLNGAISQIMTFFGVGQDVAHDILANEIITTAETLGLTVALSKARLPLALADKLGFTTKGFAKRVIPTKTAAAVNATKGGAVVKTLEMIVPALEDSKVIIASASNASSGFKIAADYLLKTLSVTFIGFIAVNNLIDFGNWNSGAYQKTFQKIFAFVTGGLLVPDADYRQTKTVSPAVFDKVYTAYKSQGAIFIDDPFKKVRVVFTRDNLIDLLDQVGAKLLLTTQKAATKDVLLASQLMIIFDDSAAATAVPTTTTPTQTQPSIAGGVPTEIKIYTGVISNGTLGTPAEFISRPDDMIQSMDELRLAAKNNLAAFVTALPGNFFYEVAIVNTIKTRGGFTQKGEAVRVVTGYYRNGKPRYKTIYHKFAVMKIGVFDENRKTVKLGTIVLGPVNAVDFKPSTGELISLQSTITSELFTTNINDISTIITPNAVTVTPVTPPPPTPTPIQSGPITDPVMLAFTQSMVSAATPSPTAPIRTLPIPTPGSSWNLSAWSISGTNKWAQQPTLTWNNTSYLITSPQEAVAMLTQIKNWQGTGPIDLFISQFQNVYSYFPNVSTATVAAPAPTTQPAPVVPTSSGFPRTIHVKVDALAVRSGPGTNYPLAGSQRLNTGDIFTATGNVAGENVSGQNRWWLSSFGNYVWQGGTIEQY